MPTHEEETHSTPILKQYRAARSHSNSLHRPPKTTKSTRGAGGGVAPQLGGATLPSGGGTQKGMPKVKERLLESMGFQML